MQVIQEPQIVATTQITRSLLLTSGSVRTKPSGIPYKIVRAIRVPMKSAASMSVFLEVPAAPWSILQQSALDQQRSSRAILAQRRL